MNPPKSTSIAKKVIAGLLALTNAVFPVVASASQYLQLVPVSNLIVDNSPPLDYVNVDKTNTSVSTIRVGGAFIKIAPSSVDLGSVAVGHTTVPQTLTITNLGSAPAVVGALSVPLPFKVTNNCDGATLPTLGTCQVNVVLAPTQVTVTALNGILTAPIFSGTDFGYATAILTGTGIVPAGMAVPTATLLGFSGSDGALTINPNSQTPEIHFASALFNRESSTKSFTLSSTGAATLAVNAMTISGNDGAYSATSDCPSQLPSGQSCTITVRFAPINPGDTDAALNIATSSAYGNNLPVLLYGTGTSTSTFSLSTGYLNMGSVEVNSTKVQNIAVLNTGNVALDTPVISVEGTRFTASHNCGTSLAVGASCDVAVAFAPLAPNEYLGSASIGFAIADSRPQTVTLVGTGHGERLYANPLNLAFGEVVLGSASAVTYTVGNSGNAAAPLTFGDLPTTVARTGTCDATLAADATCTVILTFSPTLVGPLNGALSVTSTATAIGLGFNGMAVYNPSFALNTSSVNFGNVDVNRIHTLDVIVTNDGNINLATPVIGLTGNAAYTASTCPDTLAKGATCAVTLTFAPTAAGAVNAQLSVNYAGATLKTVDISGTGVYTSAFSLSSAAVTFDLLTVGNSASRQVVVRNTGNLALSTPVVGLSGTYTSNYSATHNCPATLAVDASCMVQLTFTPAFESTQFPATLSVRYGALATQTTALAGSSLGTPVSGITGGISNGTLAMTSPVGSGVYQVVTVTNSGNGAMYFSSPAALGAGTDDAFTLSENTCTTSAVLAINGGTCSVKVTFHPTLASTVTGSLVFVDNTATPLRTVTLSGFGSSSALTANNTTQAFGDVNIGSNRALTYAITNSGNVASSLTFDATPASVVRSGTCTSSLAAQGVCTVVLTFNPTTTATVSGAVHVTSVTNALALNYSGTGIYTPSISLNTPTLSFGGQDLGGAKSLTIVARNNGNIALATPTVAISGNTDYTASACAATLAIGASCTLTVTFTPTNTDAVPAQLSVSYASAPVQTAALTGVGTLRYGFSLSAASLTFAQLAVNATSAAQQISVLNNGNVSLTATPVVTLGGSYAASYSATHNCPISLAAGSSCTVSVTFAPTFERSAFPATLSVSLGALAAQSTSLSGSSLGTPAAAVSGGIVDSTLSLTSAVGGAAGTQTVTLSNTGNGAMTLSSNASIGAGSAGAFSVSNNNCTAGTVLAVFGGSCTVRVNFTPSAATTVAGTLVFTDNAAGTPQTITLSGLGTGALAVTIVNNGNTVLTTPSVSVSGSSFFSTTHNCPATLAVNATCVATVTFAPSNISTATGTLWLSYSGLSARTVGLSGTGQSSALTVDNATQSFGGVEVGTSGVLTYTLTNVGNVSTALTFGAAPAAVTRAGTCGATLAATASCTVVLTYTPVTSATFNTPLTVTGASNALTLNVLGSSQDIAFRLSFETANLGLDTSPLGHNFTATGTLVKSTATARVGTASALNNGTGYLSYASSASMALGTGDFTFETWVNPYQYGTAGYTTFGLFDGRTATSDIKPLLYVNASGMLVYNVATVAQVTGTTAVPLNQWSHVAVSRSGTSTRVFLNGVQQGTTYADNNNYGATMAVLVGTRVESPANYGVPGYLDEAKLTRGLALYTAGFTVPQPAFAVSNASLSFADTNQGSASAAQTVTVTNNGAYQMLVGSVVAPTDYSISNNTCSMVAIGATCTFNVTFTPTSTGAKTGKVVITHSAPGLSSSIAVSGFAQTSTGLDARVTLQLGFEGATMGLDSSNLVNNMTVNGTVTKNTGNARVGSASALMSSGYLTYPNSQVMGIGTSDFTIEGWVNPTSYNTNNFDGVTYSVLFDGRITGSNEAKPTLGFNSSGFPVYEVNGTGRIVGSTVAPLNQWSHLAVSRQGTTTRLFLNGVQQGAAWTDATDYGSTMPVSVGAVLVSPTVGRINGSIDDVKFTRGQAWYTSAFTVGQPTIALSATSLNFTDTNQGATSAAQTVTVTNYGAYQLYIGSVVAPANYAVSNNNCSVVAAAGSSCTFDVAFTPTSTGAKVGTVTLTHSAPGTYSTLAVNGFAQTSTGLDARVTLQLGFEGATMGLDSSNLANNMTVNGVVTKNTANARVGAASALMNSGYLTYPNSQVMGIGTSDFTIEGWVNQTSVNGSTPDGVGAAALFDGRGSSWNDQKPFLGFDSAGHALYEVSGSAVIKGTTVAPLNQWNHLAVSRQGTMTRLFLNGVQQGSWTDVTDYGASMPVSIGRTLVNTSYGQVYGSIDDVKFTRGQAWYTSAFTVGQPTIALSATSLNFTDTNQGATSAAQTVTVTNAGAYQLYIGSVVASANYTVSNNNCSVVAAAGSTCTFDVTFTPTSTGAKPGTVTLTHSAPGTTSTIAVNGFAQTSTGLDARVTLQLGFEGATTGLDSSNLANNMTVNGAVTKNTANARVGAASALMNSGYLTYPNSQVMGIGTSDFTIEGWVNQTSVNGSTPDGVGAAALFDGRGSSWNDQKPFLGFDSAGHALYEVSGSAVIKGTTVAPLNQWNHLAVSRQGTMTRLFLNGVQQGSWTDVTDYGASMPVSIGRTLVNTSYGQVYGSIDDVRFTRGQAWYTSAFTVGQPTIALSATSLNFTDTSQGATSAAQTVMVTNFGDYQLYIGSVVAPANYAVSNNNCSTVAAAGASCTFDVTFTPTSTGAKPGSIQLTHSAPGTTSTIVVNGFGQTAAGLDAHTTLWLGFEGATMGLDSSNLTNNMTVNGTVTKNAGNARVDAASALMSSGYLSYPNSQVMGIGTSDFTIEGWVNPSSLNTNPAGTNTGATLFDGSASWGAQGPVLGFDGAGHAVYATLANARISGSTVVPLNQWNHLAVARSGTTTRLFLNGVLQGSWADSTDYGSAMPVLVGATSYYPGSNGRIYGSIDEVKFTRGQALYTSAFTVVQPAVAFSATSLSFADTSQGTTSAAQTVTVTNLGALPLYVGSIAAPANYTVSNNNCGVSLAVGLNCTFDVAFSPTSTGTKLGSILVTANVPASAGSLSVSGFGQASTGLDAHTTLWLSFEGATTGLDSSNLGNNMTVNGTVAKTTLNARVGSASAVTSSGYLSYPNSQVMGIGTSDFTIEGWVNQTSINGSGNGVDNWTGAVLFDGRVSTYSENKPTLGFDTAGHATYIAGSPRITGSTVVTLNQWNHLAVSRQGTTTRLFLNGVLQGTYIDGTDFGATMPVLIGANLYSPASYGRIFGSIDEVKFTRGQALYTAAFTVAQPAVSLSPTSLSFSDTNQGATSAVQTVTVTNSGGAALYVGSVAAPANYAISSDTCTGATIAVASTCTFGAAFTPTSTGSKTANITILHSAPGYTSTVAVAGFAQTSTGLDARTTLWLSFEGASTGQDSSNLANNMSVSYVTKNTSNARVGSASALMSGGYLTYPNSQVMGIGTSDFTIEGWVNQSSINTSSYEGWTGAILFDGRVSTYSENKPTLGFDTQGHATYVANGTARITGSTVVTLNQWNHLAVSRQGTTTRLFLNGVLQGSYIDGTDFGATMPVLIGAHVNGPASSYGRIYGSVDEVKFTRGQALYTSAFTIAQPAVALSTTSLSFADTNQGATSDAQTVTVTNSGAYPLYVGAVVAPANYAISSDTCTGATVAVASTCTFAAVFTPTSTGSKTANITILHSAPGSSNTVAVAGFAQTNSGLDARTTLWLGFEGATTGLDSSNLANNMTVLGVTKNTNNARVGSASALMSSGYLTYPNSPVMGIGTSDFTIEGWVNQTSLNGANYDSNMGAILFDGRASQGAVNPVLGFDYAGRAGYNTGTSSRILGTTVAPLNQWNHLAVSRQGTTTRLFLNGVLQGSYIDGTDFGAAMPVLIGANVSAPSSYGRIFGSIDEVKFTRGQALYTSAFTIAQPAVSLSTTSLSFADTNQGATSDAQTVTVTNSGAYPLYIGSVAPSTVDYTVSNNACATTLAVGATCTFDVTFTPASTGTKLAAIVLKHSAPGTTSTFAVSGWAQTSTGLEAHTTLWLGFEGATMGLDSSNLANHMTVNGTVAKNTGNARTGYASALMSGGYLTYASSPVMGIGTSDFTIEGWVSRTSNSSNNYDSVTNTVLFDGRISNPSESKPTLGFDSSGRAVYEVNQTARILGVTAAPLNQWNHLAVSRSGATTRLFLNGALQGSWTDTTNYGSVMPVSIGAVSVPGYPSYGNILGSIDEVKFTRGQALYTTAFTVDQPAISLSASSLSFTDTNQGASTASQTVTVSNTGAYPLYVGSVTPPTVDYVISNNSCTTTIATGATCSFDVTFSPTSTGAKAGNIVVTHSAPGAPLNVAVNGFAQTSAGLDARTTLWLGFEGATLGLDSSNLATNLTANGTLTKNTATARVGSASANMTSGYLSYASSPVMGIGISDFTIEGWVNQTAINSGGNGGQDNWTGAVLFDGRVSSPSENKPTLGFDNAGHAIYVAGSPRITGSTVVTLNQWNHLAVSRQGTTTRLFLNGVVQGTWTDATNYGGTMPVLIGGNYNLPASYGHINGSIDEVKFTRGQALYTSAFTVPQPTATLSATSLSFADTNQGATTPAQTVTITNSGSYPLYVGSVTPPTADYTVSNSSCAAQVAAGAHCTFDVTFTPTSTGAKTGNIVITHSAPGTTSNIAVSGFAQMANGLDARTTLWLGFEGATMGLDSSNLVNNMTVNGTVSKSTVNARVGSGSALMTSGYLTYPNSPVMGIGISDFTIEGWVNQTSATTLNLDGGVYAILFDGRISSTTEAKPTLGFDASNRPVFATAATVRIQGTTPAPFSQWNHLAVSRAGTTTRLFLNGVLQGTWTDTTDYGNTMSVAVGAAPPSWAASYGHINGSIDDIKFTRGQALYTSSFTVPQSAVTLSASSIDFGNVSAGSSSQLAVAVNNTGNTVLLAPAIGTSGTGYTSSNNCGATLAVGASCAVTLTLTPTTAQPYPGTLSVGYTGLTVTAGLSGGSGTAGSFLLSTSSVVFGSVPTGSSSQVAVEVNNTGALDLSAPVISTTGTGFSAAHNCAATLAAGTSCTVVLSFVPTATQAYNGTMSVAYNGLSAQTSALSGFGTVGGYVASNFATWNPADQVNTSFWNGNLTESANYWTGTRATQGKATGKWYWEVRQDTYGSSMIGIADATSSAGTGFYSTPNSAMFYTSGGAYFNWAGTTSSAYNMGQTYAGTVFMFALDMDNNAYYLGMNGTWLYGGVPTSGASRIGASVAGLSGLVYPAASGPVQFTANFGASSFSYTVPSGYNRGVFGGTTAPFSVSSTALVFGSVAPTATVQKSVLVSNVSGGTLTTPAISATGTGYTASHNCAATLANGASCTVTLTFAPTAAQSYYGSLSVGYSGQPTQTVSLSGTGQSATLAASPTTQAFGNVNIGTTAAKTYTLKNNGNSMAALSYSAMATGMTQGGTCTATLNVGASCTVVLTYAPTDTGTTSGTLTVSAPNTSVALSYSGTGVALPSIGLSSSAVAFGDIATGDSSSLSLTVSNSGNVPLVTPAIVASGTGYSAAHNCPASLSVADSCTVTLTFAPTAPQAYAGSLSVTYGSAAVQTATLSGTGRQAVLAVDRATQPFGNVAIGSTSSKTYTLTNNGNLAAALSYSAMAAPVVQSGTCATTLGAGASCTVVLTYLPTDTDTTVGSLTVSALKSSVTLDYSGTGVALPSFSLSSTAVDFGGVADNASSQLAVSVNNSGNVTLSAPVIDVTGTGYSAAHDCPQTLPVGASCTVTLTFAPTAPQAYMGNLAVAFSALAAQTATLSGTGQSTVLSLDAAAKDFGNVNIGSTGTLTYALTNSGNIVADLTYGTLTTGVTRAGTCSATLGAGASCTLVLSYKPTDTSVTTGSLSISAPSSSTELSFSGTGVANPSFSLSASSVDFGGLAIGATSQLTVSVNNSGNVPLNTPTITTTAGYTAVYDCADTLAVGASCTVTLTFAPTAPQSYPGILSVGYSDVAAQTATLSGVGQASVLALDTSVQAFGSVNIGATAALAYTLTNAGNFPAALSYSAVAAPVTRSGTCEATLGVGANCTVVLTFAPTDTATTAGSLTVTSPTSAVTLSYSGTGVALPGFSLSSTAVDFGSVTTGTSSQLAVSVNNSGNVPVSTPVIGVSGSGYSAAHNCADTLAVGASCTVILTLAPTALQGYTGALSVAFSGLTAQTATLSGTGQGTLLVLDAPAQAFGSVNIGATSTLTYSLSNAGNFPAALSYSAVAAPVTQSGTCATTLGVGAYCTVILTFAPTDTAPVAGSLTITSPTSAVTLSYSGTGVALPSFGLSGTALDFGNVASGASSQLALTVNNSGNVPLTTPAIAATGAGYSAAHNCAASLAVGASCTVTLTFSPTAAQSYPGSLSVAYDNASAQVATLAGIGQQAYLTADSTVQAFGAVNIGATSSKTYTLTNSGNLTALLSYSAVAAPLTQSGTCATTLGVGASCTVVLSYAPTDTSTTASALTVSALSTSVLLSYSGTGVALPGFSLSSAAVDFDNVASGASAQLSVTVNNSGNVALSAPAIGATGTGYTGTHNCPSTLAVGASCTVTLTFAPTAPQDYAGSLSVGYSGLAAQTAILTGTGQSTVLGLDAAAKDFGNVNIGSTGTLSYLLTNSGNIAAALTYGAPTTAVTRAGTCAATLGAGASCTVVLSYTPTDTSTTTGSLSISAPSSATSLSFSGTGVANPSFGLSASSLAFGDLATGSLAQMTVSVNNSGNVPLATPIITTSAGYTAAYDCAATLAVGTSCTVTVTFAPDAPQSYPGILSVGYSGVSAQTATLSGTGQAVVLATGIATQAFGDVNIGATSTLTYTLTNSGNIAAALSYSAITAPVAQSGTCAATLGAGASCTVVLTYAPVDTATTAGSLTVSSPTSAVTLSYSGTGVALPGFGLSAATVAFGNVATGANSQLSVTVNNSGNVALTTPAIAATGTGYSAAHNCAASLAVGASCTVTLTFAPTAPQDYMGSLSVAYSNAVEQTATLTGTGQQAVLAVDAATQAFGDVSIGATSAKTFTLTNNGNAVAALAYGSLASGVTQGGTCATTLGVGATCTVVLTYAPTDTSATSGALTVSALSTSVTLSYSGTGVALPGFGLSATTVAFGNVASGASSQLSVTVNNSGNVALTAPAIAATGTGYSAAHNCAASLAVGTSCTVTLTFAPAAAQDYAGSLSVAFSGLTAQTASLTGTGQSTVLGLDATTKDFGNVNIGSTGTLSYLLTNSGNITASLSYGAPTAGVARTGTCSSTLGAGASCTIVLSYTPTDTSTTTGSLSISAPSSATTLSFSGTGVANPSFGLSASSLAFGDLATDSFAQMTVSVNNSGNVPLATPAITTSAGYTAAYDCAATLAVGASCLVTVTFAPTAPQSYPGILSVGYSGVVAQTATLSGTGQSAVLAVDTATQDFGSVNIGLTSSKTYTVTNNGNIAATLVIGAVIAPVTRGGTCATTLSAGSSCTVVLTYAPTDTATVTSSLAVSATNTSVTLSYSGTGVANPSFGLSASSVAFGNLAANTTAQQSVTVNNTGNVPLSTPAISTTGAGYSATHNCASTLAVAASCIVTTTFAPTAAQVYSGTLSVSWSGQSAQAASLSGTGLDATLSTPTIASTQVGQTATVTSTLTNLSPVSLTLTAPAAMSVSGTDLSFISTTCGTVLSASSTCSITLAFSPTAAVSRTGSLTVSTAAGTKVVSLSGTGVAASSATSATSLTYASTSVGATSAAQAVVVSNTGMGPVTVGGPTVGTTDYTLTHNCPSSLAAGASCTVTVTFAPQATTGTLTDTLTVPTSAGTKSVSLSGVSVPLSVALATPSYDLVYEGQNAAWLNTGHAWAWSSSGYVNSAAVGDFKFEAQLTNSTSAARAVTLNISEDNSLTGILINGVSQSFPECASANYGTLCVANFTILPGTSVMTVQVNNAGASANPAGFSAWVVDTAAGAILADTSVTTGVSRWFYY